ncbi:MAG TPA: hypothetical protein VE136_04545, partial [Anaerolineales bacterium]|nr:hypothetical protein [Anaerolineales bacterium]
LCRHPTARDRASWACVLRLPHAAHRPCFPAGDHGLSRFPYEVFPSMLGVSDPAEPALGSR